MTGSSTVANEHDGLLAFGISGAPNASAAYGRITAGALSLGGTVDPVFEHGFAPPAGSEYVVDTGASSGSFATVLQGATADYSHAGEVGLIGGGPPTATTTSLTTSAPTGLPFEQSVRLTATVAPASGSDPTGSVTFSANDELLGSAPVSTDASGTTSATLDVTTLPVGSHSITATYGGDVDLRCQLVARRDPGRDS